jgi:hypothetical protein
LSNEGLDLIRANTCPRGEVEELGHRLRADVHARQGRAPGLSPYDSADQALVCGRLSPSRRGYEREITPRPRLVEFGNVPELILERLGLPVGDLCLTPVLRFGSE